MNAQAGNVMHLSPAALAPSRTWGAVDVGWEHAQQPETPEDWTGLERMEQVVARQRSYMVRDIIWAVLFAALAIAVVLALP